MMKFVRAAILALALSPLAALAAEPVDINTADASALEQVKGIGPARAAAIVKYRSEHGAFASVDDLVKVPGIGDKSLAQIREQVTAGEVRKSAAKSR